MKIKKFNEMQSNSNKLMKCFMNLFTQLGFTYIDYSDYTKDNNSHYFDLEFFQNGDYIFAIKFTTTHFIYKKSIYIDNEQNEIMNFIPEYLKTIKGLEFRENPHDGLFLITDTIDNIIKQISKEDFELKLNSFKYNL